MNQQEILYELQDVCSFLNLLTCLDESARIQDVANIAGNYRDKLQSMIQQVDELITSK